MIGPFEAEDFMGFQSIGFDLSSKSMLEIKISKGLSSSDITKIALMHKSPSSVPQRKTAYVIDSLISNLVVNFITSQELDIQVISPFAQLALCIALVRKVEGLR